MYARTCVCVPVCVCVCVYMYVCMCVHAVIRGTIIRAAMSCKKVQYWYSTFL